MKPCTPYQNNHHQQTVASALLDRENWGVLTKQTPLHLPGDPSLNDALHKTLVVYTIHVGYIVSVKGRRKEEKEDF